MDLSAEVAQTKGFFGPDRPGMRYTSLGSGVGEKTDWECLAGCSGKYEMEVRVLSSPYLGVEAAVTLPIAVEAK